jgi:hypothetical protein
MKRLLEKELCSSKISPPRFLIFLSSLRRQTQKKRNQHVNNPSLPYHQRSLFKFLIYSSNRLRSILRSLNLNQLRSINTIPTMISTVGETSEKETPRSSNHCPRSTNSEFSLQVVSCRPSGGLPFSLPCEQLSDSKFS